MRRKILLAEDINVLEPSQEKRSQVVKQHVAALAEKLGASIDLAHIDDLGQYPAASYYKTLVSDFLKDKKARLKRLAQSDEVSIRPLFINGPVVPTLIKYAKKKSGYDLVALGTHGRRGLTRAFLGSVAEEVIRSAEQPTLVVGPEAQRHAPRLGSRPQVLVATDLGPNSKKAEVFALSLAKWTRSKITFIHSLFEGFHPIMQTAFATDQGRREMADLVDEARSDALKELKLRKGSAEKSGVSCDTILDDRAIAASESVLREIIKGKHTWVVLGTHGRNLVTQAFLGSTARQVILRSPVPVVSVRSR